MRSNHFTTAISILKVWTNAPDVWNTDARSNGLLTSIDGNLTIVFFFLQYPHHVQTEWYATEICPTSSPCTDWVVCDRELSDIVMVHRLSSRQQRAVWHCHGAQTEWYATESCLTSSPCTDWVVGDRDLSDIVTVHSMQQRAVWHCHCAQYATESCLTSTAPFVIPVIFSDSS